MPRSLGVVLLIEDNRGDARLLREMFSEQTSLGTVLEYAETMRGAELLLTERAVDVILLDLGLPDAAGISAVQRVQAAAPRAPLVVLTGLDDDSLALQALNHGAQDYLVKGQIEARGLVRALRYAIERKRLEEALFSEKERAQVTLNCIGEAVVCTDIRGAITFLNVVAEQLTGWSGLDAAGRPISEVLRLSEPEPRESTPASLGSAADPCGSRQPASILTLLRPDGRELPVEQQRSTIRDRAGAPTGTVIVFRDVSEARAMSLEMVHAAEHDSLTSLPNRALLHDRISQAVAAAKRHVKSVALLFLDLDGFKHINDSLGHPVGDKLLQSVAARLKKAGRAADTVSRQGGDEFVVLLSEIDQPEDAAVSASRILAAIAAPHSIDEHELHVTASIGISVFPNDGQDAETLIKSADTAMYQAKENGRQRYQFFKPVMNARVVERQFIEQGLRRALERHEFRLQYQPKIDLKTGAITGAEALIRWTHPTRGQVLPVQFIPIAEACGLIVPVGHWVLREACLQARAWLDAGLPATSMAVNVSALEFRQEGFLEGLAAILEETGFDPCSLELELTESVLMMQAESAALLLQSLRARGVRISLDDFGTGYSNLSYLQRFPVDTLKIDQSFVGQIVDDGSDPSIVTALLGMARSLKVRVVAEGVETLEQHDFLRDHACEEAQGYFFSRPVAPHLFACLLKTGISPLPRA